MKLATLFAFAAAALLASPSSAVVNELIPYTHSFFFPPLSNTDGRPAPPHFCCGGLRKCHILEAQAVAKEVSNWNRGDRNTGGMGGEFRRQILAPGGGKTATIRLASKFRRGHHRQGDGQRVWMCLTSFFPFASHAVFPPISYGEVCMWANGRGLFPCGDGEMDGGCS